MSFIQRLKTGELSRWAVAFVLIPPTVLAILLPNKLFLLALIVVIGTMAWREFSVNLLGKERKGLFALGLLGYYLTIFGASFFGPDGQLAGLVAALVLGSLYLMYNLAPENDKVSVNLISRFALGHLYLTFLLSFIMLIKQLAYGSNWLIFIVLVTAFNDTGAFYVGSRVKGPKLYPKVSPNKTISGLLGGLAFSALGAGLSSYYLPLDFTLTQLVVLGVFLGFWGTLGDLFESALKRAMGIKDTSTILRGHGGIWDRLDSLLFNLPPVYFYINWLTLP
ncbi:MAG: phosphatidate cytidylyltransferase [Deltaproteobacteria bacterium]|nr:phosphatidate cytidylyltransferase [Deltaproteobacteria bacterium]